MSGAVEGLPVWVQYAWAAAGMLIAVGGFIWILAIFWPFVRWTRRMTKRGYRLQLKMYRSMARLQREAREEFEKMKQEKKKDFFDRL